MNQLFETTNDRNVEKNDYQKKDGLRSKSIDDDDDSDYDDEETNRCVRKRHDSETFGSCVACHMNVRISDNPDQKDSERGYYCSRRHLLCRSCVHDSVNDSGSVTYSCVVCETNKLDHQLRDSKANFFKPQRGPFRGSDEKMDRQHNFSTYSSEDKSQVSLRQRNYEYHNSQSNLKHQPINHPRCHQQRSYCSIVKKDELENGETSVIRNTEYSRRPIRCPRVDCAMNIALSSLTHHFLFDHPEVPIICVEPGVRSTLIISYPALSCDSSRCLALLLVSGKLSNASARLFNNNQIHPKYRNRLPLPVLAARLKRPYRSVNDDRSLASGEGNCDDDIIIAWVAGLDIGHSSENLRCSIQAIDGPENEGFRSLTYTGPVNSLRTAQRPYEVFKSGDCVVLHGDLIKHITSGCTSLIINVVVH